MDLDLVLWNLYMRTDANVTVAECCTNEMKTPRSKLIAPSTARADRGGVTFGTHPDQV